MDTEVEGLFRPNDTLINVISHTMREYGHGWFERFIMRLKLRSMSRKQRRQLEQEVTGLLVASGHTLPVNATVGSDGILVGDWQDLLDWFMENWPAILEMILTILAIFMSTPQLTATAKGPVEEWDLDTIFEVIKAVGELGKTIFEVIKAVGELGKPPAVEDEQELRLWVLKLIQVGVRITSLTPNGYDDDAVAMIQTLIDNQTIWDLIYRLLTNLLRDKVIVGMATSDDVKSLSTALDIDPELVLALIELLAKVYDWWRNR